MSLNTPEVSPIKVPKLEAGSPDISMAPLIDVVFLLLIFFMVTTVFPENKGLVIERPESQHSDPIVQKKMVIVVAKDGTILFKDKKIATHDIERLVKEQLIAVPNTAVLLRIDKSATTQTLVSVMDACKKGG